MAALHSALKALEPVDFDSLPQDDLKSYLLRVFSDCETLIDSVPIPPADGSPTASRSRAQTVSSIASNASDISSSSARSAPPSPEHAALQKEWGKAIKLSAKENPLGIAVYKLPAKDGRGAWFARRSVHEGMGFLKWKTALRREFPVGLEVQGGPGQGNIRGIGGERRLEEKIVDGVGKLEVYQLSAQFPGPTAPRDFVTMLLTSSRALDHDLHGPDASDSASAGRKASESLPDVPAWKPRHFVVVSKPCAHRECPPRDGFVRGQYESIEFIREVPVMSPANERSVAALDLPVSGRPRANTASLEKEALLRNASRSHTFPVRPNEPKVADGQPKGEEPEEEPSKGGLGPPATERKRGQTISFAASAESKAKPAPLDAENSPRRSSHDDPETNPVEWVMITRSDPGGNVPRWMVERGTPAGIVADATKFLDWACQLEGPLTDEDEIEPNALRRRPHPQRVLSDDLQALDTNGRLWGIGGAKEGDGDGDQGDHGRSSAREMSTDPKDDVSYITSETKQGVVVATAPVDAVAPANSYLEEPAAPGPGAVADEPEGGNGGDGNREASHEHTSSSELSSIASFATASSKEYDGGDGEDDGSHVTEDNPASGAPAGPDASGASAVSSEGGDSKKLNQLQERKRKLDEKLAATRSKILSTTSSSGELAQKHQANLAKAEERHRKEVEKHEQQYRNHVKKLESKRERQAQKDEAKRRKQEDKDERGRLTRERDDLRRQVEAAKKETSELMARIGELQSQNTHLIMRLGKVDSTALQEVLAGNSTPSSGARASGSTKGSVASAMDDGKSV